jgi:pimeloyl-ACP methyl ester carboxylesterase
MPELPARPVPEPSIDDQVIEWERGGERVPVGDHEVWCRRFRAATDVGNPPLLVLHGFPTCSFDWRLVLPTLAAERDVIVLDVLGFGLSDKPDRRYSLRTYADEAEAVARHYGLTEVDLLTHDMGDSIGGELLARSLEGTLGFRIRRRVLTNGSIYIEMAQLTLGQQFLLALPDERHDAVGADGGLSFRGGVEGTFAPGHSVDDRELDCIVALAARDAGLALLPRTIRYIEDRRAEERRFTGAIEVHPSPIGVVWGDLDPVAVHDMAYRFLSARPDAPLITLDGVGHYPMLEAPERFADAVLALLDGELAARPATEAVDR